MVSMVRIQTQHVCRRQVKEMEFIISSIQAGKCTEDSLALQALIRWVQAVTLDSRVSSSNIKSREVEQEMEWIKTVAARDDKSSQALALANNPITATFKSSFSNRITCSRLMVMNNEEARMIRVSNKLITWGHLSSKCQVKDVDPTIKCTLTRHKAEATNSLIIHITHCR